LGRWSDGGDWFYGVSDGRREAVGRSGRIRRENKSSRQVRKIPTFVPLENPEGWNVGRSRLKSKSKDESKSDSRRKRGHPTLVFTAAKLLGQTRRRRRPISPWVTANPVVPHSFIRHRHATLIDSNLCLWLKGVSARPSNREQGQRKCRLNQSRWKHRCHRTSF
jgi:hypothetical protein